MTKPESLIIRVPEMAALLDRTEAAVRTAANRGNTDWLPPRMDTKALQWYRPTVVAFLEQKDGAKPSGKPRAKRAA